MPEEVKTRQKRVFEIAKELNISHIDILKFLKKEEIPCTSLMTSVDESTYLKILEEFAKEKDVVERFRKEKARREAEYQRKAEEEALNTAREEREKIESEVFKSAFGIIQSAIDSVIGFSSDIYKNLIHMVQEEGKVTDVVPEQPIVEELVQQVYKKPAEGEKAVEKAPEKKKKKEKRKLRVVAISEIESRLDQKGKRRGPEPAPEAKKGKRGKIGRASCRERV